MGIYLLNKFRKMLRVMYVMLRFCYNCHFIKIYTCFDFVLCILIYLQDDKISGDKGETTENVSTKKVVFQDELINEDMSELDVEAIGKSIIVVPDSESSEVFYFFFHSCICLFTLFISNFFFMIQPNVEVDFSSIDQTILNISKDVEVFKVRVCCPY